jgi:hypothetical protein
MGQSLYRRRFSNLYSRASGMPFAVYAYAASMLSRPHTTTAAQNFSMTRDEAAEMVGTLLDAYGAGGGAEVFRGGDVAGVMLGRAEVFFEYYEGASLYCAALIYRFRREPRPGRLQRFFQYEAGGAADSSGGSLEYREETRSLLLGRFYLEPVSAEVFAADVKRLAEASLFWADEVLERVAEETREG